MIVAADHPARGALGVRGNATAMASRADLLNRLAVALTRPGVDGVLGTADILAVSYTHLDVYKRQTQRRRHG